MASTVELTKAYEWKARDNKKESHYWQQFLIRNKTLRYNYLVCDVQISKSKQILYRYFKCCTKLQNVRTIWLLYKSE